MGQYHHRGIEQKWRQYWREKKTFIIDKNPSDKPKYYVLDMFPYPSGSGLHVGHPLGYIATDIIARYKRAKGFNVLHPMGFDAFGLPAEQYAIERGVHPAITTEENAKRYWEQMSLLGFSYDPDCVLRTSDKDYYKWTQWIFLQLFGHYYCNDTQQARPITELEQVFEAEGNQQINAATSAKDKFSAADWKNFTPQEKQSVLMQYRLAYHSFGYVNWCPALGTVLANDEVKDGKSERGGHPVERRKMPQWVLRITAYADRLLSGLNTVDFSESIKASQTNWIGKSEGGQIRYAIEGKSETLEIFTTRPDTIFGNTYMVIAPEHDLVETLTTPEQKTEVETYVKWAKNRSERERQSDTTKTGVFTGSYAIHPFSGEKLPVWIADYVLIGYGTGAIMAVPAHDERDYEFAGKFGLPVREVVQGGNIETEAYVAKDGILTNSDFINGMTVAKAIDTMLEAIEGRGIGKRQITYRMRDVIWSRQRYWGEPTPFKIKDGIYYPVNEDELPVELPEMEDFKPTGRPESPLIKATEWRHLPDGFERETNTMPGAAGSSWYFLRYFDRDNTMTFSEKKKSDYWMPVDLYLGGAEHAVGHLLYSRFWTKFLKDIGKVSVEEPYKKLVNQGMIQGTSAIAYRHKESNRFVSADLMNDTEKETLYSDIHMDVRWVRANVLDVEKFRKGTQNKDAEFTLNDKNEFRTDSVVEKMSKRYFNTVDPADVCEEYGADTLRIYEMFLGPLEMSKPWSTEGIEGVVRFLRRVYSWYVDDNEQLTLTEEPATKEELKSLHKLIKKISEDIEKLSFNTCVPAFMVFVKEMVENKSFKKEIMLPFLSVLAPFAPHLCEELNERTGGSSTILEVPFPDYDEAHLIEAEFEYPIQINGKVRTKILFSLTATQEEVESTLAADKEVSRWLEGKTPKKVIIVNKRIINVVV
ncbi:MAG: leucine--tRNA ligase [Bacteroidia bacterium]|nr:leucine--tRNA ligase [Bacteroidia bacterium]